MNTPLPDTNVSVDINGRNRDTAFVRYFEIFRLLGYKYKFSKSEGNVREFEPNQYLQHGILNVL